MILALTQAPSPLWYFARAAGFVSLILLAFTVGLGLALTLRWRTDSWPTFISDGLHRYLATVFFVFLGIHVETLLLDPFTKFTLSDLLIPFVSTYRPFWMALGICAAELALALQHESRGDRDSGNHDGDPAAREPGGRDDRKHGERTQR